jgi:hypothetical protein
MGGMAPPAASARGPFTAFRASRITTIAVVSSSTSRWWVRRASSALTSFSFAGSRSATVRLVSIASVRLARRWGVVHIAADPPVDPPEPDAARLRGPALALRRRFGRREAGSRGEDPDCAEDHDQRADRLAVHPTIISCCRQLVQIYPIRQTRGRAQVLVLEARVRRDDRSDAAAPRGRLLNQPGVGPVDLGLAAVVLVGYALLPVVALVVGARGKRARPAFHATPGARLSCAVAGEIGVLATPRAPARVRPARSLSARRRAARAGERRVGGVGPEISKSLAVSDRCAAPPSSRAWRNIW